MENQNENTQNEIVNQNNQVTPTNPTQTEEPRKKDSESQLVLDEQTIQKLVKEMFVTFQDEIITALDEDESIEEPVEEMPKPKPKPRGRPPKVSKDIEIEQEIVEKPKEKPKQLDAKGVKRTLITSYPNVFPKKVSPSKKPLAPVKKPVKLNF